KPFSLAEIARVLRHLTAGTPAVVTGERRRFPRRTGDPLPVLVADPQTGAEPASGGVGNRPLGGVCLLVDQAAAAGTGLQVRPATAPARPWVLVEVKYRRPLGDRWALGCQFVQPPPSDVLQLYG